jgi:hypothetical protein
MDLVRDSGLAVEMGMDLGLGMEKVMGMGILSCMGNSNIHRYHMNRTSLRNRTPT